MEGTIWGLALIGVPALLVFATVFFRARERMHIIEAVKSAAEAGHAIPAEAIYAMRGGLNPLSMRRRDLRRAVTLLSTGLAFGMLGVGAHAMIANTTWGGAAAVGIGVAALGAVPTCIGMAFLIAGLMEKPPGESNGLGADI